MKTIQEILTPDELCFYGFMRDANDKRGLSKDEILDIMIKDVPKDSGLKDRVTYIYDNFIINNN